MAARSELPGVLAAINKRFRTPHASILLTSTLMLALTLSGTFLYAVTISTIARLLIYAGTCAALPVLRRRTAPPPSTFRVPAGTAVAVAVLCLTAWLLWNSTWREGRDTAIAAAVGLTVYAVCRKRAMRSSRES